MWTDTKCEETECFMLGLERRNPGEPEFHQAVVSHGQNGEFVNYVKGANIAGFIKVADAMLAYGAV